MNNAIQRLVFDHKADLPDSDQIELKRLIDTDQMYEMEIRRCEQQKQKAETQQFQVWMDIIRLFQKHNI